MDLLVSGETAMPEIVKICYNSIVSNIHDRPVHLLTKDNIASHVTLPNYIYDRLNRGELSYTHFSDILRICLLFDKGGIWMDSTLLITDSISIPAPDYFHSIKIVTGSNTTISAYRWATFSLHQLMVIRHLALSKVSFLNTSKNTIR